VTCVTLVSHHDGYQGEEHGAGEDVAVEDIDVGGVFYAIGHEPNTGFLRDTPVELDGDGYVQTADAGDAWATTATAVDGVFAAGDVMDPGYQQAVTAAGTGSMAALDAETWLESNAQPPFEADRPATAEADD
jgi:thioredoxin reductase (NADPH)